VYGKIPPEIPKLRAEVDKLEVVNECREFDIPFYKRYLIDKQIPPADWISIEVEKDEEYDYQIKSVEDLEADGDEHNFSKLAFDLEVFDDEVHMASFYSEDFRLLLTTADIDREFVEQVESEEELIKRFKQVLEEQNPDVNIIGLQPREGSRIPGIRRWPEAYLPAIYDSRRVDRLLDIDQQDAERTMRELARQEGIFCGVSSGGAVHAALTLSRELSNAVIVAVICDRGDRYLSTGVFS
jgi:hypothetical protein